MWAEYWDTVEGWLHCISWENALCNASDTWRRWEFCLVLSLSILQDISVNRTMQMLEFSFVWNRFLWANRTSFTHNLSSFVDFYILNSTDNRNAFLSYCLEAIWLSEFTCSSTEIMEWAEAGHQTVTVVVLDRQEEVLSCGFSGYGFHFYPQKQMKIKDTDYFYSEDVSCTMILAS